MTFIEATKFILEKLNNKPMSSSEIWEEIKDMVDTKGKTPQATLNSIILNQCINSPLNKFTQKNKELFKIIGENPMKFQLVNFVPKNVRESLINDGFITKEMLKEILLKNNINIEI